MSGMKTLVDYIHPCPDCGSTKVYFVPDGDEFVACCMTKQCRDDSVEKSKAYARERLSSMKEGNRKSGVEAFNLGARYSNACLSRWFAPDHAQEKVMAWLNSTDKSLAYVGASGCGKTYLAACIVNRLWENKEEVYYLTHRRLVSMLQATISDGKPVYDLIKRLSSKKYLVLDDLGSASNTEWQKEMILEVVDTRYKKMLPTMYTSNLKFADMCTHLGDRIASRVFSKENIHLESWIETKR